MGALIEMMMVMRRKSAGNGGTDCNSDNDGGGKYTMGQQAGTNGD